MKKNSHLEAEIWHQLKAIIMDKLNVEDPEITKEASLTHDLGADDLDVPELHMEFESTFNVEIFAVDIDEGKLATCGQILDYILERK